METALFSNRMVPVGVFQRLRKSPDDRATCPVCGDEVFLSAAASVVKTASFNHLPRIDGEARCPLSYPYQPSYSWLQNVEKEVVQLRADRLKSQFYEPENLKRAFTFLTALTGKGAINSSVFALLLRKADQFDVWMYAGLPVWAVPYILLTFSDFVVLRPSKPAYVIRFIIDKPTRSKLNTTWLHPSQCSLAKYFVNDGKATKLFGVGKGSSLHSASSAPKFQPIPNPLPFSEQEFRRLTSDTSWISSGLQNLLQEMAMVASVEPLDSTGSALLAENSTTESSLGEQGGAPVHIITYPAGSAFNVSPHVALNEVHGRGDEALAKVVSTTNRSAGVPRRVDKEFVVGHSDEQGATATLPPGIAPTEIASKARAAETAFNERPTSGSHEERIQPPTVAPIHPAEAGASLSELGSTANVEKEAVGTKSKGSFWAWVAKLLT